MQRMQRWKGKQWLSLPMLLILLLTVSLPARAQEPADEPVPPSLPAEPASQNRPYRASGELIAAPAGWNPQQTQPTPGAALAASAPDGFGYTWDDTEPFAWMDATSGTITGMSGFSGGQHVGPVALGFTFPYYENAYSQVYIAASGFLSFSEAGNWPSQSQIPASGLPNNVIAPYWAPFQLATSAPSGRVYYKQAGSSPARYFVVEWYDVPGGSPSDATGGDDLFRFEVILHENGDIVFQYDQMRYSGSYWCGSAGIEDAAGTDGLALLNFCGAAPSQSAVRFSHPAPQARLRLSPSYQGSFANPGGNDNFLLSVRNIGDLGADTYDLTTSSTWPVTLLAANGTTPLADTDGDGILDTGTVAPGSTLTVTVRVSAPAEATLGASNSVALTATSSLDLGKSKTAILQAAIPTRFAQVFRDDADGAMSLLLVQPQSSQRIKATSDGRWGYNPAVVETADGNLLTLWERRRFLADRPVFVSELEYALLDHVGNALRAVSKLTDQSAANNDTYDGDVVTAAAPDGSLGVAWRRRLAREASGKTQEYYNVFFTILNRAGEVVYGPLNLTQNNDWYQDNPPTYGVPRFWNVRIAATDDNRFVIGWQRESVEAASAGCSSNCTLNDIYYTVRSSTNSEIKPITRHTSAIPGADQGYTSLALARLIGNRVLVAYNNKMAESITYGVLDSQGERVRGELIAGQGGWSPAALQLTTGRILLAWTAWTGLTPQIRFSVLDGSTYNLVAGPIILNNPASATGDDFASLAPDASGHAVLTWMDYGWSNRQNLYYALIDGVGDVVTSPMIFLTAGVPAINAPRIETSFNGYGNTSYRQFLDVPVTHSAAGWIERLFSSGITSGCSANPLRYCPEDSVTRAQMAIFLERGMNGSSYTPPPATGTLFTDVPLSHPAAAWIEKLFADGITGGCGQGRYCPENPVTRAQMAIFLLRAEHGAAYSPPAATGIFADVPVIDLAAAWIEQLYNEGITGGCSTSPRMYCPGNPVSRAQMAVFLVRAFHLP